ncbi:kinase non-catalytic C-lobe domain-containing protein 1 [Sorex araneus]|uniref:kinase non-catalytic C-lobe domain-containing protein 1 n=1 Tax=Sorex araneus TaxID=42254 RepID=UPI002433553F|nr:kinase non-catalytic C-lobe domain-containing protein 1 [Sorex araneus]
MQATNAGAARLCRGDSSDLDLYDFEPLPTLAEDEENVSLADVLSLRDGSLGEQEAWAVCLECGLALRSVAASAPGLFHTLCITPDTLAFNSNGSICFMEQLSDDPEGAFVPPEFDDTGNTFEAHVYSLGATLKAALEYVAEPAPQLSQDLEALLGRMQAEDPADRPDLQSIMALCEEKLQPTSSCRLCRSLSAAGRRVLSLESFGALPDAGESPWRGRVVPKTVAPTDLPAPEEPPQDPEQTGPGPGHAGTPPPRPLLPAPVRNGESFSLDRLANLFLDAQADPSFRERSHLRKVGTSPRLLPEGPEAGAPGPPLASAQDPPVHPQGASEQGASGLSGSRAQSPPGPEQEPQGHQGGAEGPGRRPTEGSPPPCSQAPPGAGPAAGLLHAEGAADGAGVPGSAAHKQGVSLRFVLSSLGRPFREHELWALSHACLSALRTLRQHPARLCLDSVLLAEDGAVLLGPGPDNGAHDTFFLAPEVTEQRLVTEKASVYCVAAVLWAAAKFSVPRDHKLALPCRLKALLLDMARRSAQERLSAAEAVQICGAYLLQRGLDGRDILARLQASACKADQKEETIRLQNTLSVADPSPCTAPASHPGSGFTQLMGDTGLVPRQGPVPSPGASELPVEFTSAATHFKPIMLLADTGMPRDKPAQSPKKRGFLDREDEGQQSPVAHGVVASPRTPEQPALDPGPESHQEPEPRELAQGCPPVPCPAPALEEAASPVVSGSPEPSPPPNALLHQGPEEQEPPGPSPEDLSLGSCQLVAKMPRNRITEHPSQEHQDTLRAAASPDSPRGTRVKEHSEQAPECKFCLSSVDAPTGPACPALQEAMRLIQDEFAFDGYLDNGLEALIMGEYIQGLKDLTYPTFCGAVSEKFCDLYWGDKLLRGLFSVVNGPQPASLGAAEQAPSQPRDKDSSCVHLLRGSPSHRLGPLHRAGKESHAAGPRASCAPGSLAHADSDEPSQGNLEVGFRPQRSVKAGREPPPVVGDESSQSWTSPAVDTQAEAVSGPEVGGSTESRSCCPGWRSAFYEADCFGADVSSYAEKLSRQRASGSPDTSAHNPEVEQQLLMEQRNFRKTLRFYQKLLQKEKRGRGSEVKTMLAKLKGQLEDMRSRVHFLRLVQRYLQVMHAERWGLEPCTLPMVVSIASAPCDSLDFSPLDESSSLIFYNVTKHPRSGRPRQARALQAGTPLGLMAFLYSSDAFLEGYVQQFLYTFRYFCSPQDFLQFLLERISSTLSGALQDPASTFAKIYRRSVCLLHAWVEDCYAVDFARNAELRGRLQDFVSKILPRDGSVEHLLGLLEVGADQRAEGPPRSTDTEDPKEAEEDAGPLNALCKRLSEDSISRKNFPWRLSRASGLAAPHRERQYSIASALPKPCVFEGLYGPCTGASEKGSFFLTEYSTSQLSSQLTLLQEELFQKCHPVHFLNSRSLGITDTSTALPRSSSSECVPARACSLFLPDCTQDPFLLQLLRHGDDVSTWVAAEIVTCHGSKLQVNLLSKFLLIAKSCYEQRNFATAMQILGGLEHTAVRQSPAWRVLPAKVAEVLEELKAVEVFLKSDSLCLMEGRRCRAQPTLPSARLLAMHVQQLETGGFTMTNGAHRWSKLRNIARVASQVCAFQENPYTFAPDAKLQAHLKQRMARFSGVDISLLAADSRADSRQLGSEKHSRRIQDKLRRMRATFQ